MGTADTIAATIRTELTSRNTHITERKIHALLYLAQAMHLAAEDRPLFRNAIVAIDAGVQVDGLTGKQAEQPTDSQFAISVLIAGRYGGLPTTDLEALIRGQQPWQEARKQTLQEIDVKSLRRWVRGFDHDPEATVTGVPRAVRKAMRGPETEHRSTTSKPDSREEIAAFIAEAKAGL